MLTALHSERGHLKTKITYDKWQNQTLLLLEGIENIL